MNEPLQILLACTSEISRNVLTAVLAAAGYSVSGAADAWRARRLAESGRYALAIVDVFPDEPARELVRDLRRREPGIKILALSSPELVGPTVQLEVDHIAITPLRSGELLSAVERLSGPPSQKAPRRAKPAARDA